MEYQSITNFNFNEVTKYVGPKHPYTDREYGYEMQNSGSIIFTANYFACPCIYYVKKDNLFCYSFDVDNVVNFAKENNIPLTDTFDNVQLINENIRKHIKSSIIRRYKYNVSYIEGWEKVILSSDGSFAVKKNNFKPFVLEIKDNYDEFKKFLIKYKKLVNKAIDDGNFIPTLTGGLDTRALSGLYRNNIDKLDGYLLNSIKQDGKNNKPQGLLEMELANIVARSIGLKPNRVDKIEDTKDGTVTLSGLFNENANEYKNANDVEYVYKIIQHGYSQVWLYDRLITPYMEDDYLKFKQHGETLRVLLILLLTPDLIHVPFVSGTSFFNHFPSGTTIPAVLGKAIDDACEILNSWGMDKVNHILDEDYNG